MTEHGSAGGGWETVVGLEVHCELSTATKLFCSCPNAFGSEPNTNVCPVCLGLPGSLPVLNARAVEFAMRIGSRSARRSRRRFSTGRTTSTPTCRRTTRSASTTRRSTWAATSSSPTARSSASCGPTSRRTPARRRMSAGAGGSTTPTMRSSTTTAPACRSSRSSRAPDIRSAGQARDYVTELRGDPRRDRDLRRPHGGGLAARRRQHLGPPGGRRRVRDPQRDQEPQLAAVPRACRRLRGGPPDRHPRGGRHRAPGDPPLERGGGPHLVLRSKEEADDYRYFPEPDLVRLAPAEEWPRAGPRPPARLPARARAPARPCCATRLKPSSTSSRRRRPRARRLRGRGGRRRRRRGARARPGGERAAGGIEGLANLTVSAFTSRLLLEHSQALSATQAKTVLGELLAHGGDPAQIATALGFEQLSSVRWERPSRRYRRTPGRVDSLPRR